MFWDGIEIKATLRGAGTKDGGQFGDLDGPATLALFEIEVLVAQPKSLLGHSGNVGHPRYV